MKNMLAYLIVAMFVISGLSAVNADSRGTTPNTDSEPNDTFADATVIDSFGSQISGTLDGPSGSDPNGTDPADIYKVALSNSGNNADKMIVTVQFNTSTPSVSVMTYDPYLFMLDSQYDSQSMTFGVIAGVSGYYYINISSQFGSVAYNITVNVNPAVFSGNTNNDPANATTVSTFPYNSTDSLDGDDDPNDQQDFFKVTLSKTAQAADLLVAYLDPTDTAKYALELYREVGSSYVQVKGGGTPDFGATSVFTYGTTEAGNYYVRIWAVDGHGQYVLSLNKISISYDDNNDQVHAQALSISNHQWSASGEVGEGIDPDDYFSFPLRYGGYINATITSQNYDPVSGLPAIKIAYYDPYGVMYSTDPNQTDDVLDPVGFTNGTAPNNGTHFLRVYVLGSEVGGGAYTITGTIDNMPEINETNVESMLENGKLVVQENSQRDVDLSEVFTDVDGDPLTYTVEKLPDTGSAGFYDDSNLSLSISGGVLTVKPRAGTGGSRGWVGTGDIAVTAYDGFGLNNTWYLSLKVKGTNHPPYVASPYNESPYNFTLPDITLIHNDALNSTASVDLSEVFADEDGDKLSYEVSGENLEKDYMTVSQRKILVGVTVNGNIRISFNLDPVSHVDHTGVVNIRFTDDAASEERIFEETVYFSATDDGDPPKTSINNVSLTIKSTMPGGQPPRWVQSLTQITFEEDSSTVVDFDDFTTDPDPDDAGALTYTVSGYGDNITVEKLDRSRFRFSAEPDFYGTVEGVTLNCTDTYGFSKEHTVKIIVTPVPDAPEIVSASPDPDTTVVMTETDMQNFSIEVKDVDSDVSELLINWSLNGVHIRGAVGLQYSFDTDYDSAGEYTLTVEVKDNENTSLAVNVTWNITVSDLNRKPENVKIISPDRNATFTEGRSISFKADVARDPDGDNLTYEWYDENGNLLSNQSAFETKSLKKGEHTITLKVSDGKDTVTDTITIKVKKKKESPGFELLPAAAVLGLLGALALRRRMR